MVIIFRGLHVPYIEKEMEEDGNNEKEEGECLLKSDCYVIFQNINKNLRGLT
jgi:hypothetical protein